MVQPAPILPIVPPQNIPQGQAQALPPVLTLGVTIFNARDISNPKPLSEYTIEYLAISGNILNDNGLPIPDNFDTLSISLLFNLTQPDDIFRQMKPKLEKIFQKRFTPLQLHRHLNNMLMFALCLECRELVPSFRWSNMDTRRLIDNQLSLLSIHSLMEAAKWSGNQIDNRFLEHLVLFLELEGKHKVAESHGKKKSNHSLLPNAVRNFLISDAMLSEETPTSLFEANAVYGSQVMKLTAGSTMAFATAPVFGPYSALFLGIPFLISFASKAYFSSLNAPPNIYPLFDSREIDLSHAENFLGRDEIIKEILATWQTNKHPLLVGSPGVGKTTILELAIQRIVAGLIPGFERKVAFMGSASQVMAPNPMGAPHLERMVKSILPFRNNVILALDEFHALTADKTSSTYVRTMLDGSNGSIRYGLFATTTEDYEKHIQSDESLSRRLKVIDVKALSRNSLIHLLHREVKLANPYMEVTQEAIEEIYQQTNGSQNESRQLLYKIIRMVEVSNCERPCYVQQQELKGQIQRDEGFARSRYINLSQQNNILDAIAKANDKLELVQEECDFFDRVYQKYLILLQDCNSTTHDLSNNSQNINDKLTQFVGENGRFSHKVKALSNATFIDPIQNIFKKMLFLRYFDCPNRVRFLNDYSKLFQLTHIINRERVIALLADSQVIEQLND